MSIQKTLIRIGAALVAGVALMATPLAQAQNSTSKHVVLDPAQPSDTAGKIEVLEFFAYSCPHCAAMEPLLEKWSKTLPADVVLRRVPVAFNAGMADLQKLYYTLESMNRLDLHNEVFKNIHQDHKRIFDASAIAGWAADHGLDRAQFESVFKSFGVQSKVGRANELAKNYKIDGTPSLTVGGKYVVSPSMTNSYQGTIDEAQRLLDGLRKK